MLACDSDCSNSEGKDGYVAKLVWSSMDKPYTCDSLKPMHINQQDEVIHAFGIQV